MKQFQGKFKMKTKRQILEAKLRRIIKKQLNESHDSANEFTNIMIQIGDLLDKMGKNKHVSANSDLKQSVGKLISAFWETNRVNRDITGLD